MSVLHRPSCLIHGLHREQARGVEAAQGQSRGAVLVWASVGRTPPGAGTAANCSGCSGGLRMELPTPQLRVFIFNSEGLQLTLGGSFVPRSFLFLPGNF